MMRINGFEPVPELEGDIVEINEATLQANSALVKEGKPEEDEKDDNDELDLLCVYLLSCSLQEC